METEVKAALITLLDGIKAADAPAVSRGMERLDGIVADSSGAMHPQLAHFLRNRSYAKALVWLEGESVPAGRCGGGAPRSGPR